MKFAHFLLYIFFDQRDNVRIPLALFDIAKKDWSFSSNVWLI